MNIRRIPEKHAGGKWQLRYASALGGNGNLEVDLNYMFRVPLYGIHKKSSHNIGTRKTKEISLLDIHELGAGKLSALFGRHASRDLFDAHQLLTKGSLDIEQLRLACLVYGAMGTRDWRWSWVMKFTSMKESLKISSFLCSENVFRNDDWLRWTNQLLADCRIALKILFPLSERERAFLQNLFEHGTIDATLATNDRNLIEKINAHPLLQWKAKLVLENRSK